MNPELIAIIGAAVAAQSGVLGFVLRWAFNGLGKKLDNLVEIQRKRDLREAEWFGEYRSLFRGHVRKCGECSERIERFVKKGERNGT